MHDIHGNIIHTRITGVMKLVINSRGSLISVQLLTIQCYYYTDREEACQLTIDFFMCISIPVLKTYVCDRVCYVIKQLYIEQTITVCVCV